MATCTPPPTTVRSPTTWPATASTTALVEAARSGDAAAWRELVLRYEAMVRRIAVDHRLQGSDADDAVQNTWLRAVERLDTVEQPERVGGWLRTTAQRECLKVLREKRREGCYDIDLAALADAGTGPEGAALDDEARTVLTRAVDRLPDRRRRLIRTLYFAGGPGYTEVSRAVGIPIGSIGPTRRRALHSLRSELDRVGYLPEGVLV
jgi:RNA polymerase sigma factor (sigma-70 family)